MQIYKLFSFLLNVSYSLTHSSTASCVDYSEYRTFSQAAYSLLIITIYNLRLDVEEEQFPKPVVVFISS